tara:strand:+ start:173 stop:334 length:162 start_codon:yes stop_codon:yes gene_type:complete
MTKLEELEAARKAAWAVYYAADATADAARDTYYTADAAYQDELKKIQKESTND